MSRITDAAPAVSSPEVRRTTIERSPADVLRSAVAAAVLLILLAIEWLFGDTLVSFGSDLLRGLDALPDWLVDVVVIGTRVLAVVVLGGGLVWTIIHARWRMLVTVVVAGGAAAVVALLLDHVTSTQEAPAAVQVGGGVGPLSADDFPTTIGIAVVAGVATAAAPWLSRRWRRAGWTLIAGMTVMRFLASPVSFDSVRAVLVGWLCGAAVLVVMGAPSRRPTPAAVAGGLAGVGVPLRRLDPASVDARGSTPYFATGADGTPLFVKALGEDERSADLLFRFYRRLQRRNFGDERPFSSLRRGVEHEALLALAARSVGVRTPRMVAFAAVDPNGYVLAYEAIAGRSLDRLDASEVSDDVLAAIWRLVGELRMHRIAHRDLRLANIFLGDDGEVWLIDFGFSEMAASDLLLATDVAELLASSSVYVGPDRAVASATATIDDDGLAQALDRLHLWALSGATRAAHKQRPGLLDDLRDRVTAASQPA